VSSCILLFIVAEKHLYPTTTSGVLFFLVEDKWHELPYSSSRGAWLVRLFYGLRLDWAAGWLRSKTQAEQTF
jgi:hypothetical protein